MKSILTILFFAISFHSFGQGLDLSNIPTEKVRIIDRQLKTMIKMDDELIELISQINTLKKMNSELMIKVDEGREKLEDSFDVIDRYQIRERDLIDSVNHYKMLDYGNRIEKKFLNQDIEKLESSNNKKGLIIYGLTTLIGLVGGIVIF